MRSFISPGTLQWFAGQDFNISGSPKQIQTIVLDEPGVSGAWNGDWTFPDAGLTSLTLNLPGVTSLSANTLNTGAAANPFLNSAAAWKLDGLKTVAAKGLSKMSKMSGMLRLPALETLGAEAFADSCFDTVDIGCAGLTTSFGTGAFAGCSLKELVLRGTVPTLADVWGTDTRATGTLSFAVPCSDPAWAAFLDGKIVRTLTPEEIKTFCVAHPAVRHLPFAVVSKTAFGTRNDQYLASCEVEPRPVTVAWDDVFGGNVTVTADVSRQEDGTYPQGAVLTLTAVPGATGTFAGWYGDVPDADRLKTTVSITVGTRNWVFARFVEPWLYDPAAGTIANGKWTLDVAPNTDGERTLTAGRAAKYGLFSTACPAGLSGVLDLGGTVFDGTDFWTITRFQENTTGALLGDTSRSVTPDVFVSPGTLVSFNGQPFNGSPSYRTVVIDEPDAAAILAQWQFAAQKNLSRFVFRVGGSVTFKSGGYLFGDSPNGARLEETDLGWWRLDGLSTLSEKSFSVLKWGNETDWIASSAGGTLSLPGCTCVNAQACRGMTNLTGIVLGGATKARCVTAIGTRAFADCPALKALTLHADAAMTVDGTAFSGTSLASVTFTGPPPPAAALDAILAAVPATEGEKTCVIYASSLFTGWETAAGLVSALTDDEALLAPAGTFGVYRAGGAAPSGKAWVVHRKSVYQPSPFILRLR